jgi:flagellar basal-body rod protein FlgF
MGASFVQGALEDSNVDPIIEVARMVEVQRAYEMGQAFLDREDERLRGMIRTIGG